MFKSLKKYFLSKLGYQQFGVLYGYMKASGWLKSIRRKEAIDADDQPIPWYTYSAIHFIADRVQNHPLTKDLSLKVFEFGSGNSTLWWANIASDVVSVEDNKEWFRYVNQNKPSNVVYKLACDRESYVNTLFSETCLFDVIIIDGSHRAECMEIVTKKLSGQGILIVDNSDWEQLSASFKLLKKQGFKQLEFYGIGPANGHPWGTSIFYRTENCFGI